MKIKKRTFSGAVCEQEIFNTNVRREFRKAEPRPRFKNEAERKTHRLMISRRKHARRFNSAFDSSGLYSTLTFDRGNEVHTATECRAIRDTYYRKLKRKYPDAIIAMYYGQGKATHRFHIHMVTKGIPKSDIIKMWKFGEINRVDNLRKHCFYEGIDHGEDYTGIANYLFDHWQESFGGHRYKISKNAPRPEVEDAKPVKRLYTTEKPPRAPKGYILVEVRTTDYGYLYFKYVRKPT